MENFLSNKVIVWIPLIGILYVFVVSIYNTINDTDIYPVPYNALPFFVSAIWQAMWVTVLLITLFG